MADDYSKQNPYGKPPKNETLAQKHTRVGKFYSYQRKADQQAAARGDQTAMDQLMQIGRKKGGQEGAQLQREGAERKLGINSQQARSQDQANAPGGFNARVAQGGAGALLGEGAAGAGAGMLQKLAPLLARMRGGAGQAAGQAMQQGQRALPRPGMPTRPVPGQGGVPMQRPQGQPVPARPPQGQPGQQMALPQQRALPAPQPQRALPAPQRALPKPVGKSLSTPKRTTTMNVRGLKAAQKSTKDEVGHQRLRGNKDGDTDYGSKAPGIKKTSVVKRFDIAKRPAPSSKAKGSQRSGESIQPKGKVTKAKTTPIKTSRPAPKGRAQKKKPDRK